MIIRYLSSATLGIAVTSGLLFVMQLLIAHGEEAWSEAPERVDVIWIAPDPPDNTDLPPPPPERLPPPVHPPAPEPPTDSGGDGTIVYVPSTASPPAEFGFERADFAMNDGPLVAIYRVEPVYPAAPARKGLEGFVTVRFDVNELGEVQNVVVLESSSRAFEKAAVTAAYRFKFKPRVLDGVALSTTGIVNRFRFRMPE